jgi:ABC-type branched-subunit amino acid transport system substrate-binding protein
MEDQIKAIGNFISKDLGAHRVGVLMPDSAYGWDVMSRAKPAFQDRSLEIAQMQIYPAGATDFKEQLRRMTRMDFPKLRKDEICSKEKGVVNAEGCAKKWTDLKPIVDFEVLFVPDFADTVGLLLPTLPYLQLYGIQVVGLSGFNSQKLIDRAQDSAEGVIFTDSYLSASNDFATHFFRREYQKSAKQEPSRLAAEAFDVAMLSVEIMKRSEEPISRDLFLDRLRHTSDFKGATGSLTVENQRLMREPKLITVRDGKFRELRLRGE